MSDQLIRQFNQKSCKSEVPALKTGYQVRVHQKIKEGNKERIQIFEGMVIKQNAGYGVNESFTVRKISEGIGVEKTFLIHSPNIVKVDVVRAHKVRRAKLHFLRDLSGKALRLKEVPLNLSHKKFDSDEAPVQNAEASEMNTKEPVSTEEPKANTEETVSETTNDSTTSSTEESQEDTKEQTQK